MLREFCGSVTIDSWKVNKADINWIKIPDGMRRKGQSMADRNAANLMGRGESLLFMTDEALKQFRASSGWEAGVDGNVALITIGAGERADTTTAKDPIVGFVFDAKGLIADISLKGAKFTKLNK